jgi:hypothetical protein
MDVPDELQLLIRGVITDETWGQAPLLTDRLAPRLARLIADRYTLVRRQPAARRDPMLPREELASYPATRP